MCFSEDENDLKEWYDCQESMIPLLMPLWTHREDPEAMMSWGS